jgi:hypothetical protein
VEKNKSVDLEQYHEELSIIRHLEKMDPKPQSQEEEQKDTESK